MDIAVQGPTSAYDEPEEVQSDKTGYNKPEGSELLDLPSIARLQLKAQRALHQFHEARLSILDQYLLLEMQNRGQRGHGQYNAIARGFLPECKCFDQVNIQSIDFSDLMIGSHWVWNALARL
jgi:hypothetical protein